MKTIFIWALIGLGIYGAVHYVPPHTKQSILAAVGLSDFFRDTLPTFLRSKLSIPENPVATRERLLGELSASIAGAKQELARAAPPAPGTAPKANIADPAKLRTHIDQSQQLLKQSESLLTKLKQANPEQGFVAHAAERLLDKVLGPPPASQAAGGMGGDGSDGQICPP